MKGSEADAGLIPSRFCCTFASKMPGVEWVQDTFQEGGHTYNRTTMKTPVGSVSTYSEAGWTQKHWLASREDYRVMTWIQRRTELTPNYEAFDQAQKDLAPYGVVSAFVGRTPMQVILVDHTGLESFAMHLFDYKAEMEELYEAMLVNFRRIVEIAAGGPGRYVAVLENFTAETMGPQRFAQFHVPVYKECFPMLRQAGKIVGTHYDGKLASCKKLIAESPIDLIESLTPPPEGDMTLAEARAAWPDKLFWSNINVSNYELPPAELKKEVLSRVGQAAPDGRRLAFEISEDLPKTWAASIPVVLDALRETRAR